MAEKHSYEDLLQEIQSLKKTVSEKNYLKSIYQEIGQSIIILDPEQNILSVNPATEKITGKTANDLKGKKCYQIFHDPKSVFPPESCPVQKLLKTGNIAIEEMEAEILGGFFLVSCTPVFDDQSKLKEIIHIATDITAQRQVEDNLRESEHKLATHLHDTPIGALSWDLDFKAVEWNPAAETIFGFNKTEALGKHATELILPEDMKEMLDDLFRDLTSQKGGNRSTNENITKDGRRIICDWYNTTLKDVDGNVIGVGSLVQDITESKQTFEALKKQKKFNEKLIQTSNAIIIGLDKNHKIKIFNKGAEKITGFKTEEVIDKDWFKIFVEPDIYDEINKVWESAWGVKFNSYVNPILSKNGDKKIISWQSTGMYDGADETTHMLISIGDDITERIRAEALLKESEQNLRTVADFTYDWEYWIAPDDLYIYTSPSCERITGYHPDDFINNPGLMMKIIHPDDKVMFTNHRHTVDKSDNILPINFRVIAKDGYERWIEHVCQAVYDKDGRYLGQRGSNRDITEQKKLQEEVLKDRKLESLGALAGGLAHDFNNLLYVAMGNISLAQDDLKYETGTSESLKEAEEACIKAKELTARLITFSKGGDPVKKTIPLGDLLKNTVISALKGFNIKSKISIPDAIRQVNIDEGQIKQVFSNIVVNAREAMDDNEQLTVSCEKIDIAENSYLTLIQGEYIKISFKDQGCGISKENLKKIFDPYFTTKDIGVDKGQGLGLTVSYSIVQKHGGLINVESELGRGSTFSVYLPAISVNETDFQKSEKKSTTHKPVKQSVTGTGKILFMDDEETIRNFMGRVIYRLGYDVETCIEGKEAIEIYKKAFESKKPFDVAILDLTNKFGMGGQETMRRLLEIDHNTKGIVITGYFDDPVVADFKAYGFSGFLTKPATRDELSKVINEVLSKDQ